MRSGVADTRLQRAMADAFRHVELYRRLWGPSGIDADLQRSPLLDKTILRAARLEDRLHGSRGNRQLTAELSSGSSGEPMTTYSDRAALRARRLAFLRALIRCGYRPGQRILLLTSRRDASRWSSLARWHYASIGDDSAALAKRAAELAPHILYGPLSTLELLGEHVAQHGPRLSALKLVVSTAEQLTPERRKTLELFFGAPVADFYGMTEFGLVAYRPPGSKVFFAARPTLVLEFIAVPHERAVEQLVISDLAERSCPLIRYGTGDFVRRDPTLDDCPIVAFAGRTFDCILLPNGERISPYRIDVALEHLPDLKAFEVVQQPDLSIDVTIDVAAGEADRIRHAIAGKLSALFGNAMPFRIAAGVIRRDRTGAKFRPIRSLAGARA